MSALLLAADIGGSKTRLRLLSADGTPVGEYSGIGAALAADSEEDIPALDAQLQALPHREKIRAAAINLGGRNTGQIRRSFERFFPGIPQRIFRESEGSAAYALGAEYGAPIVLMAGTGAIAVGEWQGKYVITGGWGIHIGDDGSGYDIGLQAVRMCLRELDEAKPLSPLTRHLCGMDTPLPAAGDPAIFRDRRDIVRDSLAPLDRAHIASLTKTVGTLADEGDENALMIFRDAGEHLARLIRCTADKLHAERIPAVVVTGGLVHCRRFWAESFEASVRRCLPHCTHHYVADGLLRGCSRIVCEMYINQGGNTAQ